VVEERTYGMKRHRERRADGEGHHFFRIYSMSKPVTGVAMMILL